MVGAKFDIFFQNAKCKMQLFQKYSRSNLKLKKKVKLLKFKSFNFGHEYF